jgi:hypothetical protein
VPLEGHWARQNATLVPATRREARALVLAGLFTLAVLVTVLLVALASEATTVAPGCREKTVATSTGGATIQICDRR